MVKSVEKMWHRISHGIHNAYCYRRDPQESSSKEAHFTVLGPGRFCSVCSTAPNEEKHSVTFLE